MIERVQNGSILFAQDFNGILDEIRKKQFAEDNGYPDDVPEYILLKTKNGEDNIYYKLCVDASGNLYTATYTPPLA